MNDIIYDRVTAEDIASNVFKMLNYLESQGISQKKIAEYIYVSDRTVRNWNKCVLPSPDSYFNLVRLCKKVKELRS